ncbi:choice-of-anchor X domain-containing protein [Thiolapillus sp.]
MYKKTVPESRTKLAGWIIAFALIPFSITAAWANYPAPILYKQTNAVILDRSDVLWSGVPAENYLRFGSVVASQNTSRIMFSVSCEFCPAEAGYNNRPFVADADGGGVADLSDLFPADLASSWWGWGNMRLNDDGDKAFIGAQRSGGEKSLYYKDLITGANFQALNDDGHTSFQINHDGSILYLGSFNAGYDDTLGRYKKGLFWGNLGGSRNWYLDIHDLPCNQQCDNLNMLGYVGNSAQDDHTFFVWNSGQAGNICGGDDCNHNALWHSRLDGIAQRITDEEHYWVDSDVGGWRGASTAKGETVLYSYQHRKGDPQKLVAVDRAMRTEKELTWTTSLNGFQEVFITPSGRYAFVRGTMGSAGGFHRQTLLDLQHDTTRDTWSYHLPNGQRRISNLSQDRYYFMSFQDSPHAMYRIDTQADNMGDFSQAPNITSIAFNGPALWDDDGTRLSISVAVSDAQGLANIESVLLTVLVEGMEDTYWSMPREPLAFPTGDPGFTWLYDDGTHGDSIAGDGIFSFDAIATRKGARAIDDFNSWYAHYSLPNDVGIRILARDVDGNSTIADTTLKIVDCSAGDREFSGNIMGDVLGCTAEETRFLTGSAVKSGARVQLKSRTVLFQNNSRVEDGAVLSISSG